jgi:adenylosuccinate synthase
MKRAVRTSGIESIVLTKLDVLTGLGPLKVCTGYERNGGTLEDLPSSVSECEGIVPRYMEFPGWDEDLSHARSWGDLPTNARKYIEGIATLVGCPVGVVSVGAGREATMVVDLPPVVRDFIAA